MTGWARPSLSAWLPGAALLALACVAAGCASSNRLPAPVAVTCQTLHMISVPGPNERVEFPLSGYSVVAPQGSHWCVGRRDARGVIFSTHPLLGRTIEHQPSQTEILHTLGLITIADEVPRDASVGTPAAMFAFVEQRFLRPEPRFTVVQSSFRADPSPGAECVRFDAMIEERDNPGARDLVLVGVLRDNVVCRHPSARTPTLVLLSTSERYVRGTVTGPLLIDTLRSEWEASVRSLRFLPRP